LSLAFHNFCRTSKPLHDKAMETEPGFDQTPAMAFGLTGHVWTVEEILA
jgi:hypothetical protein